MKLKLCFLLLIFAGSVWGQDSLPTDDSAKKKEINSIKLNGEAIYADVYQDTSTDSEGLDEAHQRAQDMLKAHVIEIFSKRLNMTKEDVREIWAVIEKNSQNIVVKKGDLSRVFTYVMKASLGLEPSKKRKKADLADATTSEEVSKPATQPAAKVEPQPEVKATPVVESKPEVKVEAKAEEKVEVKAEAAVVAQPEVKAEPKPEVKPEPAPKAEATVEVPALCQTILSKGNYAELRRYLDQEKSYGKLMYGGAKRMQYHEKCYIVIFEKDGQGIVTVLDKGQTERMNFVSKQMDTLNNYRNGKYQAIFVQEL